MIPLEMISLDMISLDMSSKQGKGARPSVPHAKTYLVRISQGGEYPVSRDVWLARMSNA